MRYGASPRGAQALVLAAKIRPCSTGRFNVSFEDIRRVAPALRHRLILNFDAEADGIEPDGLVDAVLQHVIDEPGK